MCIFKTNYLQLYRTILFTLDTTYTLKLKTKNLTLTKYKQYSNKYPECKNKFDAIDLPTSFPINFVYYPSLLFVNQCDYYY